MKTMNERKVTKDKGKVERSGNQDVINSYKSCKALTNIYKNQIFEEKPVENSEKTDVKKVN